MVKRNASTAAELFPTRNDLPASTRATMVQGLNQALADAFDLYSQTKQAHWNVKGPDFIQLHELFDQIAAELIGFVDSVAERVTALGGTAMGTVRMSAAESSLPEYPVAVVGGMDHVAALADRFAAFGARMRRGIDQASHAGDQSTADLYTEISRAIDMRLWFLEAHLQGGHGTTPATDGARSAAAARA